MKTSIFNVVSLKLFWPVMQFVKTYQSIWYIYRGKSDILANVRIFSNDLISSKFTSAIKKYGVI